MKRFLGLFLEFDYDIVGSYYDHDGNGNYIKKYNRRRKFRRKAGGKWHYLPM